MSMLRSVFEFQLHHLFKYSFRQTVQFSCGVKNYVLNI